MCSSTSPKTRQSTLGSVSDKSSAAGSTDSTSPVNTRSRRPVGTGSSACLGVFLDSEIVDLRVDPAICLGQRSRAAADLEHDACIRRHEPQQVEIDTVVISQGRSSSLPWLRSRAAQPAYHERTSSRSGLRRFCDPEILSLCTATLGRVSWTFVRPSLKGLLTAQAPARVMTLRAGHKQSHLLTLRRECRPHGSRLQLEVL